MRFIFLFISIAISIVSVSNNIVAAELNTSESDEVLILNDEREKVNEVTHRFKV